MVAGTQRGEMEVEETQVEPGAIKCERFTLPLGEMTPPGRPPGTWFGVYSTRGLLIGKRSQALISSGYLPRRQSLFLSNEKKNEAPAGATWSDYSGTVNTKTVREQASPSDCPSPEPPSSPSQAWEAQLRTARLFCQFQMPQGEIISSFIAKTIRGSPSKCAYLDR